MMKKIFIVGCPRSGTTLLQSFLASNSKIVSFPETHLYSKTISINPIVRTLTLYRARHLEIVEDILSDLGVHKNKAFNDFGYTFKTREWVKFLNGQLNLIGEHFRNSNEEYLLEKTPRHLHFIDLIQDTEKDAFFIHLIRNGEDVVASLSEATGNNPEEWSGERSVDKSIFWWNRSIRISQKYIGLRNNCHIRYENLVKTPDKVLNFLSEQIGLPFEEAMLNNYHETASSLISEEEVWKAKNTRETLITSDKFERLSPAVQDHIRKQLHDFDYQRIDINSLG